MSKERRLKNNTTPRPNRWQSFRSQNLAVRKKSKRREDFNLVQLDRINDVVQEMDDPFCFESDSSWIPDGSDTSAASNWSTILSDTIPACSTSEKSVFYTEERDASSETIEFSSPENMRFRDSDDSIIPFRNRIFSSTKTDDLNIGSPKFASTGIQVSDGDVHFGDSIITGNLNIGSPKFVSTGIQVPDSDDSGDSRITGRRNFGKPKLTSTRNEGRNFGKPKLTSTRNEGSDNDVICSEIIIPTTKTRKSGRKNANFVDSHWENPENTSHQILGGMDYFIKTPPLEYFAHEVKDEVPGGMDYFIKTPPLEYFAHEVKDEVPAEMDYFIKTPPLEYFEHEVVDVPEVSLIPIPLDTFVNEDDKSHISKFSEEKESSPKRIPFPFRSDLQGEHSQDFLTTMNSADIVDDVFKNSNDTSSLKMNDAVLQQATFEESQTICNSVLLEDRPEGKRKRKRKRHFTQKSASMTENQDSNLMQQKRKSQTRGKRHVTLKSATVTENQDSNIKRRKYRNRRKKNRTVSKVAECEEYVQYLRTLEVCPLSLSTAPFAHNKGSVYITEEGSSKEKKKRFRRKGGRKRTEVKDKEGWDEYKNYLQSLPVCPLSIQKIPLSLE